MSTVNPLYKIAITALLSVLILITHPAQAAEAEPLERNTARPFGSSGRLGDVWIIDIGTLLVTDRDRDGWFSRLEISIDADVDVRGSTNGYRNALVFAVISLTDSNGFERLVFESERFEVIGRSFTDRYRVELDLRDDFPEDRYDLVVELRDAFTEDLLDVVDASDFSNARNLPLEDAVRDGRVQDDPIIGSFVAVEYTGATGPMMLMAGTLLCWLRRRVARGR